MRATVSTLRQQVEELNELADCDKDGEYSLQRYAGKYHIHYVVDNSRHFSEFVHLTAKEAQLILSGMIRVLKDLEERGKA